MIAYNTEAASLGRGKTHATGTPAALWNRLITRLDLYPLDDDLLYSLGFRPCLGACHAYRHWTNFDEGRRKVWSLTKWPAPGRRVSRSADQFALFPPNSACLRPRIGTAA